MTHHAIIIAWIFMFSKTNLCLGKRRGQTYPYVEVIPIDLTNSRQDDIFIHQIWANKNTFRQNADLYGKLFPLKS